MSIRMIPMSMVFNRFPRMLRDLAAKLGKKVDFVTQGEATELDKGLVEKITDPLTHLVRNSCDHGIEMPAERRGQGQARDRHASRCRPVAPGRQHRHRGARRRQGPEPRQAPGQGARDAASTRPTAMTDAEVWQPDLRAGLLDRRRGHRRVRPRRRHGRGQEEHHRARRHGRDRLGRRLRHDASRCACR